VTAERDARAAVPWHRAVIGTVAASPHPVASGLPIVLAVVFGALSIAVVADLAATTRSYASTSTSAAILDLTAGLGLVAAGAFHWWTHQRGSIGVLTALVGATWLSADWIGWADGPAVVCSAVMVVAPFLVPLVLHLSVAFSDRHGAQPCSPDSRRGRLRRHSGRQ
jgi:hypothetical protein